MTQRLKRTLHTHRRCTRKTAPNRALARIPEDLLNRERFSVHWRDICHCIGSPRESRAWNVCSFRRQCSARQLPRWPLSSSVLDGSCQLLQAQAFQFVASRPSGRCSVGPSCSLEWGNRPRLWEDGLQAECKQAVTLQLHPLSVWCSGSMHHARHAPVSRLAWSVWL